MRKTFVIMTSYKLIIIQNGSSHKNIYTYIKETQKSYKLIIIQNGSSGEVRYYIGR